MWTKTVVSQVADDLDSEITRAMGDQRDPDEVHFQYDAANRRCIVLLVWRSASKPALYQPRPR